MHMRHHVTNHLIISNDKDSNSENRIKLRVRDNSPGFFLLFFRKLTHSQIGFADLLASLSSGNLGLQRYPKPNPVRCERLNSSSIVN
jgi:hypothetical protein